MFVPSAASGPPAGAVEQPARGPRVWRLPRWASLGNAGRVAVLSRIAKEAAADPRLRRLAVQVFRSAGVEPRDYRGQAAALLRFIQDRVYFVNERDEVLQDPAYTLSLDADGSIGSDAHGDCDDQAVALAALALSVHLPVRFVTSGRRANGQAVRWVEGSGPSPAASWSHVYLAIGDHPFRARRYAYADPTCEGVPLGWDVVERGQADPQRGELGDVEAPAETIAGMTFRTAASLVAVSVAAHVVVKKLEAWGVL